MKMPEIEPTIEHNGITYIKQPNLILIGIALILVGIIIGLIIGGI